MSTQEERRQRWQDRLDQFAVFAVIIRDGFTEVRARNIFGGAIQFTTPAVVFTGMQLNVEFQEHVIAHDALQCQKKWLWDQMNMRTHER